jgi:hypothetical protein
MTKISTLNDTEKINSLLDDTEKDFFIFKTYKVHKNGQKNPYTSFNICRDRLEDEIELLKSLGYKTGNQEVYYGDIYFTIE